MKSQLAEINLGSTWKLLESSWKYGMFGGGKELRGRGELVDADKRKIQVGLHMRRNEM